VEINQQDMTTTGETPQERLQRPGNLARLGTMPDSLLGEILRVPTTEIRARRELLGIPRFRSPGRKPHVWTTAECALLGTMPDSAVAGRLGISLLQVERQRKIRGIPAYKPSIQCHKWLPLHDAMLGVKTDAMVAVELGLTTRTVSERRKELGLPRQWASGSTKGGYVPRKPGEIWTPEVVAKLGTVSDSTLAAHLKVHSRDVRSKREALKIPRHEPRHPATRDWTRAELALLGTMSDTDLAKKLGANRQRVALRRVKMGIPRFVAKKKERVWTKKEDAMLGVRTDSEVAAMLGITRKIVETRRNRLGIPRQYGNPRPAGTPRHSAFQKSGPQASCVDDCGMRIVGKDGPCPPEVNRLGH